MPNVSAEGWPPAFAFRLDVVFAFAFAGFAFVLVAPDEFVRATIRSAIEVAPSQQFRLPLQVELIRRLKEGSPCQTLELPQMMGERMRKPAKRRSKL